MHVCVRVVCSAVVMALITANAHAERCPLAMDDLLRAPVQLEVTVVRVARDQRGLFGMGDLHMNYTARVDRVIAGAQFAVGQEIAVHSVVLYNPPLTTGSSGDRSTFNGPNGLPLVGDKARLFASGTPAAVVPLEPNGWQQLMRRVALVASSDDTRGQAALRGLAAALSTQGAIACDAFVIGGEVARDAHDARGDRDESGAVWRSFDHGALRDSECIITACPSSERECETAAALSHREHWLPVVTLNAGAIDAFASGDPSAQPTREVFVGALERALALSAASGPSVLGMSFIPAGEFTMGSDAPEARSDERPARRVSTGAYWIDRTEVTNHQFDAFVTATGYRTVAERPINWEEMKKQCPPGTPEPPAEMLQPGALVFSPPTSPVATDDPSRWWKWTLGANWRHPQGDSDSIEHRTTHPVVQIAFEDALAYAKWAGKQLPNEAQWERAARGGLEGRAFVWGDDPITPQRANTWQGHFPDRNSAEDGNERTGRVASFPPNGFGLFDMAGNVWEWCTDRYDPTATAPYAERAQRGGSFLCHSDYCSSYRPSARMGCTPDTALEHLGFRCVVEEPPPAAGASTTTRP